MTSAIKHKKRSRKTHGLILFKSKDLARHEMVGGVPIFKNSKNNKKY